MTATAEVPMRERAHRAIAELIRPVCASHPCVEKVYVYGSYARGDFNELSDVDLWIILDRDNFDIPMTEYVDVQMELRHALKCPTDCVTAVAPDQLGKLFRPIMRDKVLVYDRTAD
ncbi:nucleotidyltransferase domain-containing protein [Collinsella ihumii]|nr:nucleotidyltransferase domain-containing protein [Collinsella ihumii]